MGEVFEHKNKIYAISKAEDGVFVVTKASWLPNGKKLVEEIRTVEADSVVKVKRSIRLGGYGSFNKIGE